jgi:hypothetical protein
MGRYTRRRTTVDKQTKEALDLAEQFVRAIMPHDKERQQMRARALEAIEAARRPRPKPAGETLGIHVSDGLATEDRPGG